MAFTVPNQSGSVEDPTGVYPQAQLDKVDFDILAAGIGSGGDGVSSGCEVTPQGTPDMTVAVASGTVVIGGSEVVVASGNVTVGTAHGTLPRFDLIAVANTGVKSCVAGTAAATPVFPAIPASSVILAAVYVPALDTTVSASQIIDKRVVVKSPLGASQWTTLSKAADQSKSTDTTLAADSTLQFSMAASTKYRIRGVLHITEGGGDFKARTAGPASPTYISAWWRSPNTVTGLDSGARHETAYSATDYTLTNTDAIIFFEAIIHNGTNASTFSIQWAQNVSNAAATVVKAGSYLEYAVA